MCRAFMKEADLSETCLIGKGYGASDGNTRRRKASED